MTRFNLTLALSSLCLIGAAAPAFAHAHLTSSVPAAGSRVAAPPTELELKFSEGLNLAFTGVSVKEPGKTAVTTGKASLGAGDDTTLTVPVSDTLAAGTYTIDWHALSTDGHKTHGTYMFTVK
ncbi:copper homeostasis periplasmic binding protein CopC [Lichenihabitans psoromatis]|uniref:copper homeostasis periplasmic binding protein CopC n=1 Tax=Lichenihabitans psoromatis TaxID=2528642 RepID=UPI0010369C2B|nr:copper homeostasis periplasmic binding protein CopC [Lichenihabitans psoromatis]